jgi:hypothetical protein
MLNCADVEIITQGYFQSASYPLRFTHSLLGYFANQDGMVSLQLNSR